MGSKRGFGRRRGRCWVFTIHTEVVDCPPSGFANGAIWHFWAPEQLDWDESIVRYVICGLESCPDTGRYHWQGYIELRAPVGMQRVKEELSCDWCHLEERRGSQSEAIEYCRKSDTGETHEDGNKVLFEYGTAAEDGKRGPSSKNQNYKIVLEQETYQSALSKLCELEPSDYVRFNAAVRRGLMDHYLKMEVFIRDRSSFNVEFIDKDVFDTKAVVLTGSSGIGKTAYALAHFQKPFIVSHIDQIKDLNPLVYDGVVFDDMSFNHWPVSSCIHIVDLEMPRFINCRHVTGYMPAKFPRIFTSNLPYRSVFNFNDCNEEQEKAIDRRIYHVLLNKKLF